MTTADSADVNGLDAPSADTATTSQKDSEEPGLQDVCRDLSERVAAFLEQKDVSDTIRATQDQTRTALGVIDEALEKYSLPQISLSYNGGKDCLVLLILYLAALHNHHLRTCASPPKPSTCTHFLPIRSVYIQAPHPFPAVESFVRASATAYHLSLARYSSPSMKDAFARYLADSPATALIFVGTRRTDPHGALLTHFDRTDRGWPAFMRCHPVIDWHYAEVWAFIRGLGVGYCGLYDEGYTSLGGTEDTLPNPALRRADGEGYRPAYELVGDEGERLGREEAAAKKGVR